MRVNTRYINSHQKYILNRGCPSDIYTPYFQHTQWHRCVQALDRTNGGVTVGDSGLCCCVPCLLSTIISLWWFYTSALGLILFQITPTCPWCRRWIWRTGTGRPGRDWCSHYGTVWAAWRCPPQVEVRPVGRQPSCTSCRLKGWCPVTWSADTSKTIYTAQETGKSILLRDYKWHVLGVVHIQASYIFVCFVLILYRTLSHWEHAL